MRLLSWKASARRQKRRACTSSSTTLTGRVLIHCQSFDVWKMHGLRLLYTLPLNAHAMHLY